MDFVEADLLKTAVSFEQYPDTLVPEIALVGRSNVGKSSLINCKNKQYPGKNRHNKFLSNSKRQIQDCGFTRLWICKSFKN